MPSRDGVGTSASLLCQLDNVTHALAGMLLADATISLAALKSGTAIPDRFRRTAVVLGIVAAESADLDVLFSEAMPGMGPLGYMLHHRGYTHTIVGAVATAILLWMAARWWYGQRAVSDDGKWLSAHGSSVLLVLALAGSLSHVLLDFTNSYGVHPFWPFDDRWYYGDAIFIVEPWFWVVGIPAVFWRRRGRISRILLMALLLGILVAAWRVDEVTQTVALALTLFAVLWLWVQRMVSDGVRTLRGMVVWILVLVMFFSASGAAREVVAAAVQRSQWTGQSGAAIPDQLMDVVLTPRPGDPTCWSALAVSTNGIHYRLSSGIVAPYAGVRTASDCAGAYSPARLGSDIPEHLEGSSQSVSFEPTATLRWIRTWAALRSEMTALASARCEFLGALRFMRTPVWAEAANGALSISDARFGVGDGFATVRLPSWPHDCTLVGAWIPPWIPPRMDMLFAD